MLLAGPGWQRPAGAQEESEGEVVNRLRAELSVLERRVETLEANALPGFQPVPPEQYYQQLVGIDQRYGFVLACDNTSRSTSVPNVWLTCIRPGMPIP